MMPKPESSAVRLLLDTPGLRKIGRRLISTAIIRSPSGLRATIRPSRGERALVSKILTMDLYQKYYRIKPSDVVFDIGAHIGAFTIMAGSSVGKGGRVVSIEPARDNFELMEKNVSLNKLDETCIPIQCACGERSDTAKLRVFRTSLSNSFFERESDYEFLYFEKVEVRAIDEIVRQLGIESLAFMKINVEGWELEVLKGSTNTLQQFHPSIAVDTHEFGPPVETIEDYLQPFGYEKREATGQINFFV